MHTKIDVLQKLWGEMTDSEKNSKLGKYFNASLEAAIILLKERDKLEFECRGHRAKEYYAEEEI